MFQLFSFINQNVKKNCIAAYNIVWTINKSVVLLYILDKIA